MFGLPLVEIHLEVKLDCRLIKSGNCLQVLQYFLGGQQAFGYGVLYDFINLRLPKLHQASEEKRLLKVDNINTS